MKPPFTLLKLLDSPWLHQVFSTGKKLGEGGYGQVYQGSIQGQKVAVKFPGDELKPTGLLSELQVATYASLKHPNIISLLGVGSML